MKKVTKITALLLVIVMCAGFFYGCSVFPRNNKRYLAQTALTVGDEKADLREILEFFSQYASQYMSDGQYSAQDVWDMIMPSFVAQLAAIDSYKKSFNSNDYNTSDLAKKYTVDKFMNNGRYVPDEAIRYYEKTVTVEILKTLDSELETALKDDGYKFDAAPADSSRVEHKTFVVTSVAEYKAMYNLETVEKNLENYLEQELFPDVNYVFGLEKVTEDGKTFSKPLDAQKEIFDKVLKALNDRLTEDEDNPQEEITYEVYVSAQKRAFNTVRRLLNNNDYDGIVEYAESRMKTLLRQAIYQAYQLKENKKIEADKEDLFAVLDERLGNFINQTLENYSKNPASFESFITSLSATSFIYYIPEQYAGAYGFVKNLLVPFSEEQTEDLKILKGIYTEGSPEYIAAREKLAYEIQGVYFGKTDNDNYFEQNKDLFTYDEETEEYKFDLFDAESKEVTPLLSGKFAAIQAMQTTGEKKSAFVDLMFLYNTDVGQHNSPYDYVIRKKKSDATGTKDAWVREFALCARNLANEEGNFEDETSIPYGVKGQPGAIDYCVTDYGVHFVFYSGDVEADFNVTTKADGSLDSFSVKWENAWGEQIGAGNAEFRFLSAYYEAVVTAVFSKTLDALTEQYLKEYKYDKRVLRDFCKAYNIKID